MLCYIPNFRLFRQGVVRVIFTDFDLKEIKENIICSSEVLSIKRLNRRTFSTNKNSIKEIKYISSNSIVISVSNQSLLRHLYIFNVNYEVLPFIPKLIICHSCYKFGHSSSQCRSKPSCIYCAQSNHDMDGLYPNLDSPRICANCRGAYSPLHFSWPEF